MKKTYSIVLLVLAVALAVAGGVCASALYRERMARARLRVEQARLCLIPTDGREKLCYEFRGSYRGRTYLCYISAATGRQEQLLQVVEEDTGLEAV